MQAMLDELKRVIEGAREQFSKDPSVSASGISRVNLDIVDKLMVDLLARVKKLPAAGHRRRLPDERKSLTHRFVIASHKLYTTVGMFEDGTPGEVFLKAAKEGSSFSGMMDSFAITFSFCLQYGVPLVALVQKFSNTRFDPEGYTETPEIRYAKSPVDYLARWLALRWLPPEERPREPAQPATSIAPAAPACLDAGDGPACTQCGCLMQKAGRVDTKDVFVCPNCAATMQKEA